MLFPDFVTKNDERVTTVFETRCRREFFILWKEYGGGNYKE